MLKAITAAGAVVASALLLSTASLASTASAAGDEGYPTAKVSYADLDLSNSTGADALQGQLRLHVWAFAAPTPLARPSWPRSRPTGFALMERLLPRSPHSIRRSQRPAVERLP